MHLVDGWEKIEGGVKNILTGDKWFGGPHEPLRIEKTFDDFITSMGGQKVSNLLGNNLNFSNADYIFISKKIILELKEIQTEFLSTPRFYQEFNELNIRLYHENPNFKPHLFGGKEKYPDWYVLSYYKIARPPISRILKKANKQIKETKTHFKITSNSGVLLLVNDGFTNIPPLIFINLICDLLINSYSNIDCFVYITVNSYVIINNSDTPSLVWAPLYSEKCESFLHNFINNFGARWRDYIDKFVNFSDKSQTDGCVTDIFRNSQYLSKSEKL
jgi:hypothetical protein